MIIAVNLNNWKEEAWKNQGFNKLTSLPMSGFIAQLVEHIAPVFAEVTGSNPVEALNFSGFFFPIA